MHLVWPYTHSCRHITHGTNSTLVAALASPHSEGTERRLLHTLRKARQHLRQCTGTAGLQTVEILPSRACAIQTLDAMVSQCRRRIIEAEVADSLRDQRLRTPRTPAHRKRSGKERVSCLWPCTKKKKKKRRKRDIYRCAKCGRCGTTPSVLRVEVLGSENMCHLATL